MLNPINLPARIVDPLHFVFIPEKWEQELKPYSKAQWKHQCNTAQNLPPDRYELQTGHFLAFPQFHMTSGGFYAAHVYAVVKELAGGCQQVQATLTVEGLTLETIGGDIKTKVHIKPRGMSRKDDPHSVILQ